MIINAWLIKVTVIVADIAIKQSRMPLCIIPARNFKKYNAFFSNQCAAARGRVFNYLGLSPLNLQERDQVLYPEEILAMIYQIRFALGFLE